MADQRALLAGVAAGEARGGRGAGIAASITRAGHLALGGSQGFLDQGFDEEPRTIVLRLFLAPDHFFQVLHPRQAQGQRLAREGVELLEADDLDIVDPGGIAGFHQVIGDLAGTQDDLAGLGIGRPVHVGQDPHEVPVADEVRGLALGQRMAQQRLGRHDHQRLAERPVHLPAQHVEVIRRGGDVADLDVVLRAELQEPLEPGRGVFRTLALVAVRQQHDEAIGPQPLRFRRSDILVDHDLRAVGEIAELRFPQHQGLRVGAGIAIFEAEHAVFGQRAVMHFEPPVRHGRERHVLVLVGLVDPDGVALAEGAAPRILAGQADVVAFGSQAAESERLAGGPVETLPGGEHLALGIEHAGQRLVDRQAFGNRGQRAAEAVEQLLFDAGGHVAARGFGIGRLVEAGPAPGEPVRLVGLVALGSLELLLQHLGKAHLVFGRPGLVDHALFDQAVRIDRADAGMLADLLVHQRLGEARLVAFIVAEAAIAPHVDHDVAAEGLAIVDRQLAGEGHGFGIIAVDVQDRRLDALGDVRGIGRAARELRAGGEADLVVDDEVDAAAGVVALDAREAEAFPDNALPRKGGVAVDQDGQHLLVLEVAVLVAADVVAEGLLGADLAEHHRVHRFEVRGVGHQAHVHLDPVELAVGAGAEVILHVAGSADVFRVGRAAREFVEDHAIGLGHHVGEHVEAAAVGHAIDDLAHAAAAAILDHGFQRRDHGFAAVEAEALGADVLLAEEAFVLFAADHRAQDRLLAFGAEVDRLVTALDPLLDEAALLHVGDVHVFIADLAAVIALQDIDQFAHRRPFEAERAAEVDLAVKRRAGKAVIGRIEIGRQVLVAEAQRIEVRAQVAAHAIGAHQHHRPDRIRRSFLDRARVHGRTGFRGGGLDRHLHLGGIERGGQVVRRGTPVRLGPRRPGLRIVGEEIVEFVTHLSLIPGRTSHPHDRGRAGG